MYRIRPSVAHQGEIIPLILLKLMSPYPLISGFNRLSDNPDLESNFLPLNPKVHVSPTQIAWTPFALPPDGTKVDFVDGLKTIAGAGEPSMREGLAIHMCEYWALWTDWHANLAYA